MAGQRTAAIPEQRAALLFTGHLRDTCAWNRTTSAMEDQAASCRSAFQGRCDIFVHTWDELQKTTREHLNSYLERGVSAWPCAGQVAKVLRPTAMAVENQATRNGAYKASPIDNTPFGDSQELPINFRMNTASSFLIAPFQMSVGVSYVPLSFVSKSLWSRCTSI